MRIEVQLPQIGRGRLITTVVLCTLATILWFWSAAKGLAGMRPSGRIVVAGIGIPWGVGWVTLLLMERRTGHDLQPAAGHRLPEHDDHADETAATEQVATR